MLAAGFDGAHHEAAAESLKDNLMMRSWVARARAKPSSK
jgi:hypothetical protein